MGKPLTLLFDPFQSVVWKSHSAQWCMTLIISKGPLPGWCVAPIAGDHYSYWTIFLWQWLLSTTAFKMGNPIGSRWEFLVSPAHLSEPDIILYLKGMILMCKRTVRWLSLVLNIILQGLYVIIAVSFWFYPGENILPDLQCNWAYWGV